MGYPEMMRDIIEHEGREEFKTKREPLKSCPIIDEITGFYNDKYLHVRLDEEMARAKRYRRQLSFIMLKLGRPNKLDTTVESPDEEKVLKKISDIINSCIRYDIDLAFRSCDDSFAIILPEVNVLHADTIAQSIEQRIQKEKMGNITVHTGVVQYDCHDNAEGLIRSAKDALLQDTQESRKYLPQEACPVPDAGEE